MSQNHDSKAAAAKRLGADPLDPEIGLNIPATAVDSDVRVALSNSFAFGGSNVSLVFGAQE